MLSLTAKTDIRLILYLLLLITSVNTQEDNLGLENGYITVETANFNIKLVKDAQVLASLQPSNNTTFDFLPFDYLPFRAANGQYHNGDITYRVRPVGETSWIDGDSSAIRNPVTALNEKNVLAAASMTPTLPSNESSLQVTRQWLDVDGDLGLAFTVTNIGKQTLEIGSLGFPTEFNSIFTNRTAEDIEAKCSLTDPYIGLDAGYLQVTPTSGTGAALIVTPLQGYSSTPFEAWRNLDEISYAATQYGSQVFEGFYEWQMHSKAYAENEWSGVEPWNTPTSQTLEAGNSITVGLRFSLVKAGVRGIQDAVQKQTNTPLTIGVPGYVIPQDLTAHLYIFYPTATVSNITSDANSFNIASSQTDVYTLTPTGSVWGRTKVTIHYTDGRTQTVHYFITNSATKTISQMSQFATTSMWFDDSSDPFGRSPSIITWDHSTGAQVLQEQRVWISGLSDEGGVIYLATAMKQSAQPNSSEIAKLEQFASQVLSPTLQGHPDSSVRKSIFYYEPSLLPGYAYNNSIEWGNWWSWDQSDAYNTQRAYDYIHVTGAYWALYRAGRADPSSLTEHAWDWYLGHAYNTTIACFATDSFGNGLVGYSSDGLMGETVIGELLLDLQREGWSTEAEVVETLMKGRAETWNQEAVPFGSEMAWDSTGQEGVYYWSNYFGLTATATKSVNSILGYMPTVSHWGWNGCARRYWDFIYAGKLQRIERMIHHYGSGLNALPLLQQFRQTPADIYLLRVGYGGITGPMSNIRQDGSVYNAFHSWPDTLEGDAYSGDYGPNFLAIMLGSATYVVEDPELGGLVAYGGNMAVNGNNTVTVQPRDPVRQRVYIAPLGLYITMSAGQIQEFDYSPTTSEVVLKLVQDSPPSANTTIVWVETPGTTDHYQVINKGLQEVRLGWEVELSSSPTEVTVSKV